MKNKRIKWMDIMKVFQCDRIVREQAQSHVRVWDCGVHSDGVEKVIQLTIWCDGVRNDLTYYRSATTLQTWCGFLSASYCSRHCSPFKVNHFHIIYLLVWKILSSREMYLFRTIYYACRGVNSFFKLARSSNMALCILTKCDGAIAPLSPLYWRP